MNTTQLEEVCMLFFATILLALCATVVVGAAWLIIKMITDIVA